MGMEVIISGAKPIQVMRAAYDLSLILRMVDGLPAFPDESVPEAFQEIRLGGPGGMISVRVAMEGLQLVVWGNADKDLRNTLCSLGAHLAHASEGRVIAAGKGWEVEQWRLAGCPL
ncbi:MAG: hypothetical protein NTV55_14995 [Planctomycetota bacterium]|nr:hypothetical protein [Planctomycetota bacterium]